MAIAENYDRRYKFVFDNGVVTCMTQGRYSNKYDCKDRTGTLLGVAECRTKPGQIRQQKIWFANRGVVVTGPYNTLKEAAENLLGDRKG